MHYIEICNFEKCFCFPLGLPDTLAQEA